jgi:hypothetical protein
MQFGGLGTVALFIISFMTWACVSALLAYHLGLLVYGKTQIEYSFGLSLAKGECPCIISFPFKVLHPDIVCLFLWMRLCHCFFRCGSTQGMYYGNYEEEACTKTAAQFM